MKTSIELKHEKLLTATKGVGRKISRRGKAIERPSPRNNINKPLFILSVAS